MEQIIKEERLIMLVEGKAEQEELDILNSVKEFIEDNLPEYLLEPAKHLLSNNCVQHFDIKKKNGYLDISALIQSDDFQTYTPEVGIFSDGNITFFCNCPDSFSGICSHIGAVLLKVISTLEQQQKIPEEEGFIRVDWQDVFRNLFVSIPEPEVGNTYFLFRFYPEPQRLKVGLFRVRKNKSGLSKVQTPTSFEMIFEHPEWCEFSPELPKIVYQIKSYLDYLNPVIEIPPGLLTWFLEAIRNEPYLFLEDTDKPIKIHTQTVNLQLKPIMSERGLKFDLVLKQSEDFYISITDEKELFLFGDLPIWVLWRGTFFPAITSLDRDTIQKLLRDSPLVPQNEISDFLDKVWTKLPPTNFYEQERFIQQIKPIFVSAKYNPKLYLKEEGSLLVLEIHNIYETEHGEFLIPGPDPNLQTGSYKFEGKTFLIQRDQSKEKELIESLINMKFQSRNNYIWFLEPEEAINFLLDLYPELVKKYRVYGEKNLKKYKVRHVPPKISAKVERDKEETNWFNVDLNVEYGDISVPIEKIWKAWVKGKRYIQLKDGSYASLPESWLKRLQDKLTVMGFDPEKVPKNKFNKYEAPVINKLLDDVEDILEDSFWKRLREKISDFKQITSIPQPKGINAKLRPYQLQGLSFLNFLFEFGFGGILADEMGLGKTLQTLALLQYLKEKRINGPHLIIVPTSVLPNWQKEIKKFIPSMKELVIYGTKRETLFKKIPKSDIVLTTYALLRRDLDELLKYEYTSVILDEAQNIKNPNTITARSVKKLKTKFRLCLSGTPIENSLLELWSLFEFLMPGFLGSQTAFQKGFVKPIKDGDLETLEYLKTRVKPFILRRTKSEVVKELPPKVEHVYYTALIDEQKELYAALSKKLKEQVLQKIEEKGIEKSQVYILDALLKLRQICCHPKLLKLDMPGINTNIPSGKFEAFKDLVTSIVEDGHKVLVFSQFVQMLHIIRSWLKLNNIPFCYLDGSSKDRFEQVERFNNDDSIPVFLISLKAGGTGLNLTAADYVIHYDPWWNPAVENQATDRTHRIGQTRKVFSYKLICESTVEEKILQLQESKKGVAEAVIPGQSHLKSLTREDLEMLFEV